MALFDPGDQPLVQAVSRLVFANPFAPERIELEKSALGSDFDEADAEWNLHAGTDRISESFDRLVARVTEAVETAQDRLRDGERGGEDELRLYQYACLFHIYHAWRSDILANLDAAARGNKVNFYERFRQQYSDYFEISGLEMPLALEPARLFALFFNLRRGFHAVFSHLVGSSRAIAELRAEVWNSIFTHDIERYERILHRRMGDITTLITGPSGTGKELVARAIGRSRYVPFDAESRAFVQPYHESFYPINLAAMSSTLIESELFGHQRGSFTGANADHVGYFQACGPYGTVFLDEIGETDQGTQVKLLRVLQSRVFQRLGDTRALRFEGKVIAATNRDLAREMQEGKFREDLYYRLCSDIITTRSLREQIVDSPEELRSLISFIATKEVGDEGPQLVDEVESVIENSLGRDYRWPGNFRELEQCVRNVLVRRSYRPTVGARGGARDQLGEAVTEGTLTADELIRQYCTLVYSQTGNYEETARRLGIDRRTVKSKIDESLLERLKNGE